MALARSRAGIDLGKLRNRRDNPLKIQYFPLKQLPIAAWPNLISEITS